MRVTDFEDGLRFKKKKNRDVNPIKYVFFSLVQYRPQGL